MMEGRRGGATHGAGSEPPPRDGKHVGGSEGAKHGDGGEEGGLAGQVVYLVWQDGRWVGLEFLFYFPPSDSLGHGHTWKEDLRRERNGTEGKGREAGARLTHVKVSDVHVP
jgi:hypothetical protein